MNLLKKILYLDFHPIQWHRIILLNWLLSDYTQHVNAQLVQAFKRYDKIIDDFNGEQKAMQQELRDYLRHTQAKLDEPDLAQMSRHKELIDALNRIASCYTEGTIKS